MRIAVVNVSASTSGALTMLKDFYEYVKENGGQHEWFFIVSTPKLSPCAHIKVINLPWIKKGWLYRSFWEIFKAGKLIRNLKADVVLSMQNTIVLGVRIPQVVYLHQSIPFQEEKIFSFLKKGEARLAVYQKIIGMIILKSLKKADKVIVQTQWMREAVAKKNDSKTSKILVAFPQVDKFFIQNGNPPYGDGEKVKCSDFFYPATPFLYKNHECILKAAGVLVAQGINDFTIRFTLRGNENWYATKIRKMSGKFGDKIKFEGYLHKEALLERYRRCVTVFPSYIETLGLPLLEARMANGIVIASDCPFSHELLDGYRNADFFKPFDYESLALKMKKCIMGDFVFRATNSCMLDKSTVGWEIVLKALESLE